MLSVTRTTEYTYCTTWAGPRLAVYLDSTREESGISLLVPFKFDRPSRRARSYECLGIEVGKAWWTPVRYVSRNRAVVVARPSNS